MRAAMSLAIDLSGRVALVTGASRGLGRADALTLARAGADVVIDPPDLGDEIAGALAAGGTFVTLTDMNRPHVTDGRVVKVSVVADPDDLARAVAEWRSGRLTARVADVYPLDKVEEAHRRIEAGGLRGRLVLEP
jgi:NADPH2:quinone reductase